jgi:hypothetical protein
MRSIFQSTAVLAACGLMLTASACKSHSGGGDADTQAPDGQPVNVPLVFTPDDTLSTDISLPTGKPRVYVKPVTDTLPDKVTLGHYSDDDKLYPAVVSSGTPEQFVHDGLVAELKKVSIDVVDSPDTADRIIDVSLSTFSANESGTYKGQVMAVVQVTDKSGKVLFNKPASGDSSHWGHSREPSNYQLVLSNSVVHMTSDLLKKTDFTQALSITNGPAPTP